VERRSRHSVPWVRKPYEVCARCANVVAECAKHCRRDRVSFRAIAYSMSWRRSATSAVWWTSLEYCGASL